MTPDLKVSVEFWPPARVPELSVLAGWQKYDPAQNEIRYSLDRPEEVRIVKLPSEFYLRELWRVDLGDLTSEGPRSLKTFVKKWGAASASDIFRWSSSATGMAPWMPSTEGVSADAFAAAELEALALSWPGIEVSSAAATIAMVRQARDMFRIWIANLGKVGYDQVIAEWESVHLPPCNDLLHATDVFCTLLSHGLKDLHFVASVLQEADDARRPTVSLYCAICAQMYNDISETGVPFRTCANERCGSRTGSGRQLFKRQRGRSEHGGSRVADELKYCTKSCAQAQAARESRRRARAKRAAEPGEGR